MKTIPIFFKFALLMVVSMLLSCNKNDNDGGNDFDKYSFWQGSIANKYYYLDLCGGRTHVVSGKPYMILEYDPVSQKPNRCEFGMSEVTETYLPKDDFCLSSAPEPTMSTDGLLYTDRLNLKSPIVLICNWGSVTNGSDLSDGGFDFTFTVGGFTFHFEKTTSGMTGEIVDEGQTGWGDKISDANAFNLLHKFDSNTIGN